MKKCPTCGATFESHVVFCRTDGSRLGDVSSASASNPPPASDLGTLPEDGAHGPEARHTASATDLFPQEIRRGFGQPAVSPWLAYVVAVLFGWGWGVVAYGIGPRGLSLLADPGFLVGVLCLVGIPTVVPLWTHREHRIALYAVLVGVAAATMILRSNR